MVGEWGGRTLTFLRVHHGVIYLILGLQSVSSRLSTVSVDTSRSDQPTMDGRHPDHHEHHHNHRHHHHEHHHSISPRSNQRHPTTTSTTVTDTIDATSLQSNAHRRPIPRYVRICESMDNVEISPHPPHFSILATDTVSFHNTNPLAHFSHSCDVWILDLLCSTMHTNVYVQIFELGNG